MTALESIAQVALVPYPSGLVGTSELIRVAAVLQTQLQRDVNPLWDVNGMIAPFESLSHVPPGYTPLVVVDALAGADHGFHFAAAGQPIAMIVYGDGWSVRASHELIETLCDPYGQRTAAGPLFQPPSPGTGARRTRVDPRRAEVDYLVEVCDPCQFSRYEIGGIPVSDFVTPAYYGPVALSGRRYSYVGTITEPRQLLE